MKREILLQTEGLVFRWTYFGVGKGDDDKVESVLFVLLAEPGSLLLFLQLDVFTEYQSTHFVNV